MNGPPRAGFNYGHVESEISAKTVCHCPVVLPTADGGTEMFFQGLWYEDKLVRTVDGWKISKTGRAQLLSQHAGWLSVVTRAAL